MKRWLPLLAALLIAIPTQATTAGPNTPIALFNDTGTGTQWINPANGGPLDGAFSTYTTTVAGSMNSSLASNQYGFSIPGTATLNGIEFRITWKESVSGMYSDTGPSFCGNVSTICTNRGNASTSTITTSLATTVYGSPTDNWGGITTADINDSGSTLYTFADKVTTTSAVLSVDAITETVYYTTASGAHLMMMMGVGSHALPRIYPVPDCPVKRMATVSPLQWLENSLRMAG